MRPGFDPCFGKSPWRRERLQYSHLENSMDCIVHGVSKSQTWLSNFHLKCLAVNTDDATRQVLSYSTAAKLLSRFSCVQLCAIPEMTAHQAHILLVRYYYFTMVTKHEWFKLQKFSLSFEKWT